MLERLLAASINRSFRRDVHRSVRWSSGRSFVQTWEHLSKRLSAWKCGVVVVGWCGQVLGEGCDGWKQQAWAEGRVEEALARWGVWAESSHVPERRGLKLIGLWSPSWPQKAKARYVSEAGPVPERNSRRRHNNLSPEGPRDVNVG